MWTDTGRQQPEKIVSGVFPSILGCFDTTRSLPVFEADFLDWHSQEVDLSDSGSSDYFYSQFRTARGFDLSDEFRIVAQEMSVKDILTADIATIALKFLDEQRVLTAAAAADDDSDDAAADDDDASADDDAATDDDDDDDEEEEEEPHLIWLQKLHPFFSIPFFADQKINMHFVQTQLNLMFSYPAWVNFCFLTLYWCVFGGWLVCNCRAPRGQILHTKVQVLGVKIRGIRAPRSYDAAAMESMELFLY